jgi:hypothetical protein
VTEQRLGSPRPLALAEAELERVVAIPRRGLLLDDGVRAGLENRDRDDLAGFVIDPGHADLAAQQLDAGEALRSVAGTGRLVRGCAG